MLLTWYSVDQRTCLFSYGIDFSPYYIRTSNWREKTTQTARVYMNARTLDYKDGKVVGFC